MHTWKFCIDKKQMTSSFRSIIINFWEQCPRKKKIGHCIKRLVAQSEVLKQYHKEPIWTKSLILMHASNNFEPNTITRSELSANATSIWTVEERFYLLFITLFRPLYQMCVESWITAHELVEESLPQLPPYCLSFVSPPVPLEITMARLFPGVTNRWNRWSQSNRSIDINR